MVAFKVHISLIIGLSVGITFRESKKN